MPYNPHSISDREDAIKRFEAGEAPKNIAKILKIPVRTIQRWVQARRMPLEPEKISTHPNFIKAMAAKLMPSAAANAWVESVEEVQAKAGGMHANISLMVYQLLETELSKSEISTRTINNLSLVLSRHLDGELKAVLAGNERQMDHSQAMSILEAWGYVVFDGSRLREMFAGEEPTTTLPQETLTEG
ncbi:helix-turn-helix domain-containing protein (plasmid) [Nostoc sp. C052]|uniref:helix-turn-helix domain-containing protein n=1 Tax=Nostoc sp. C052 TaxID=2576902 RepID=UPI0015C3EF6F|nr:helix-turn-helix domain-containing protein [Nostoc sp. C052]QLE46675.1 helix-turn-helix domain-containing protein [Nostoc sp. C052]